MRSATGRRDVRRIFRLEGLEGRSLLSVARPALHGVTAQVQRILVPGPLTPVSSTAGQVSGTQATDGLYGGTPHGFASMSGHGSLSHFGGVVFGTVFQATAIPAGSKTLTIANGTALFTTDRGGNQLRVIFTGTATPRANGDYFLSFSGIVVSSTGRFANVSGTFQATGTANFTTLGKFTLKPSITFSRAV
jgi:hypothetical protein